jgi:hypothetical protein
VAEPIGRTLAAESGLPNSAIDYLPSLGTAIQFYSCFISYSTSDQGLKIALSCQRLVFY